MFPDKNEESNLQLKFASHYSTPLSIWKPQQADNALTIHTCTEVRTVDRATFLKSTGGEPFICYTLNAEFFQSRQYLYPSQKSTTN